MTPTHCDHCEGPAIVWQRYSGAHLCGRHLQASVEKRARKELSRQVDFPRGARIAVAYSGGKDSTVALHLLADLRETRPDLELVAVTIDEGIADYRPAGVEVTRTVTRELGVEHHVKRTKDFAGVDVDEIHALEPEMGQCSFCGVFRRRLMNDFSKEVGATHLVTGHNLDDVAQSVLMNLASANLDKLLKLGPHPVTKEGLVPRLLPLRTIPETEVYLYAVVRGLRWHDAECPYAEGALRRVYRDALYALEEARPGTRHSLVRVHDELRPLLAARDGPKPMLECVTCGEPTSGPRCKACEFRERLSSADAKDHIYGGVRQSLT